MSRTFSQPSALLSMPLSHFGPTTAPPSALGPSLARQRHLLFRLFSLSLLFKTRLAMHRARPIRLLISLYFGTLRASCSHCPLLLICLFSLRFRDMCFALVLGLELLPQPAYSSASSLRHFCLFPCLRGHHTHFFSLLHDSALPASSSIARTCLLLSLLL